MIGDILWLLENVNLLVAENTEAAEIKTRLNHSWYDINAKMCAKCEKHSIIDRLAWNSLCVTLTCRQCKLQMLFHEF